MIQTYGISILLEVDFVLLIKDHCVPVTFESLSEITLIQYQILIVWQRTHSKMVVGTCVIRV
jgi:hypothetical protein